MGTHPIFESDFDCLTEKMVHITLTGYGPFTSGAGKDNQIVHDVNASWEAVKEVKNSWSHQVELRTREIEVSYDAVDQAVEDIWKEDPLFVVHVGVAGRRKEISIETKAKNGPYAIKDVLGKLRPDPTIQGPVEICTNVDAKLCVAQCSNELIKTSDDAGLYLCEYIHYLSLLECEKRNASKPRTTCVFIHVP